MINLRPSGAYRWSRCAAAPTFEQSVPVEPPSDEAREGTAAAWVADQVLQGRVSDIKELNGVTHENGWLITDEMIYYVNGYVEMIRSRGGSISTEQFVRLNEFIAGTLDVSAEVSGDTLHIDDLKYGFRIVETYENPQLIIYGAAELLRIQNPNIRRVELGIYQPRAFHPDGIYRVWPMSVAELWQYANHLIERGRACQMPVPPATPGTHCADCPARTSCNALATTNYAFYQVIEDVRQRSLRPDEMTRELVFVNKAFALIKARKEAIEAEAEQRLLNGEHFAGWYMKPRFGHRSFKVDPMTIVLETGIDPFETERKIVTPAELERRGADPEKIKKIAGQPRLPPKISPMPVDYFDRMMNPNKKG